MKCRVYCVEVYATHVKYGKDFMSKQHVAICEKSGSYN